MKNYYEENSKKYIIDTFDSDMSHLYYFFEKHLKKAKIRILDIGVGSGRDSLYFQNKRYEVSSLEPVKEFCEYGKTIGLKNILNIKVEEMEFSDEFDAIWACASLLHIPSKNIVEVFNKCYKALKNNGLMYCSFKYGTFEGVRDGRYFLDLNEERLNEIIKLTGFKILELEITNDVNGRNKINWLNVILKK